MDKWHVRISFNNQNRIMRNYKFYIQTPIKIILIIYLALLSEEIFANNITIAKISVREPVGISRALEYVEMQVQHKLSDFNNEELNIIAEDSVSKTSIPCQVVKKQDFKEEDLSILHIIFPISINAFEQKSFLLKKVVDKIKIDTDLKTNGEGLDLIIDNKFYSADLSKNDKSEAKNKNSGQLNELRIKMDYDQLLYRTENRMHWGPNFQKVGMEYYKTVAGWNNPKTYEPNIGPYIADTHRQDYAPEHSEILLTANYSFYAGLPYFIFFSSMNIVEDVNLFLLRNDEITMDSLFTNIAYQNNSGEIIDLAFSDRYESLENNPIQNNSPWLCFYNESKGYAFGSIRIKYDNTNTTGLPSPTYLPYTKISDGAEGGKYWNRRLINEKNMYVPKGSRYVEKNAYLIFEISQKNKFEEIINWMKIIKNPIEVTVM